MRRLLIFSFLVGALLRAASPLQVLPVRFEPNRGQAAGQAAAGWEFTASVPGHTAGISPGAAIFAERLGMEWIGAAGSAACTGVDRQPGLSNYLIGPDRSAWHTGIPGYARVLCRGVYPGIDIVYKLDRSQVEFDLLVAPGSDPRQALIAFEDTAKVSITPAGDLTVRSGGHEIQLCAPRVYQDRSGARTAVSGSFELTSKHQVHFRVGKYDRSAPLVIDPTVVYNVDVGGTGSDEINGVVADAAGNTYLTGDTTSPDFEGGSNLQTYGSAGFVVKLDASGKLVYSTLIAGLAGLTSGASIAVDGQANAYVGGSTGASALPTTTPALQTTAHSTYGSNGFVVKLNAAGNNILLSTFIGGTTGDWITSLALDSAGHIFLSGYTFSKDFPVKGPASSLSGTENGFVAELTADMTQLVYSRYLGGSAMDAALGLALDAAGNAYVTGETSSGNFPLAGNVLGSHLIGTFFGNQNAFVSKLDPTGALLLSGYLGGTGQETGAGIFVDTGGFVYVTGNTASSDFPGTAGSYQASNKADTFNCFVAKLDPTWKTIAATYFGAGVGTQNGVVPPAGSGKAILAARTGEILVGGTVQASALPNNSAGDQTLHAFLAVFSNDLTKLEVAMDLAADAHIASLALLESPSAAATVQTVTASGFVYAAGSIEAGPAIKKAGSEGIAVSVELNPPAAPLPPTYDYNPLTASALHPVSTATGELFGYDETADLELGGPLPLEFHRYYGAYLVQSGINSSLGANWMHNFDVRLTITASSGTAVFTRFRGKTVTFTKSGNVWQLSSTERDPYQLVAAGSGYQVFSPVANLIYTFDSGGLLNQITDRNGNTLTVTQGAGGPAQVADGLGRSLTFTYTNGTLTKVQDQSGRAVSFAYTGANLTAFTNANSKVTAYTYTSGGGLNGLLTKQTDPVGNTPFTQTFDSSGRVATQQDSHGNSMQMAYSFLGNGATVTEPLGFTLTTTHDGQLDMTSVTDTSGKSTQLAYDAATHPTSHTNRLGATSQATWDPASGQPATYTDALGNVTAFAYTATAQNGFTFYDLTGITFADGTTIALGRDSNGNVVKITDQAGKVWTFTRNSLGQIVTATNPSGAVTTSTYAADGTLASTMLDSGDTTQTSFGVSGQLTQLTNPDKSTEQRQYDALGNLLKSTDELSHSGTRTWDDNSNLHIATDALGATTTVAHDTNDFAVSVTDALGNTTNMVYDALNRLQKLSDAAGDSIAYSFDNLNRRTAAVDAAGKGSTFGWNAENQLLSVTDALGRTTKATRDLRGQLTGLTTPNSETYTTAYDALGRIKMRTNPLGQSVTRTFDPRGLTLSTTLSAGIGASFTRNELGLIPQVTDPNGNAWLRSFDKMGRRISKTDPLGHVTTYQHDSLQRISGITFPLGSEQLSYDAASNLTGRTFSDGTAMNYSFDAANRLLTGTGLTLARNLNGWLTQSNGLAIAWDAAGRIASITYGAGKVVTYTYNNRGLLTTVTDWIGGATTLAYDDARELISISYPNGVSEAYTYDADSRLATVKASKSGVTLWSMTLTRDADGKVTGATRAVPQLPDVPLGYATVAYDLAEQSFVETFDAMGRATGIPGRTYVWDLASRLQSYTGSDGSASFTYDALGQRISRFDGSTTRNFVLNYALPLPSVSTVRTTAGDLRYYVWLPNGALLESIEAAGGARHFYHFDETGSTVCLTNDAGSISDSYAITPYGESAVQTGATDNPFTFQGKWGVMQEGNTGLYYMRARYYNSVLSRFLSRDPVESPNPLKVNPYQYASGNPMKYTDPKGLDDWPDEYFAAVYQWRKDFTGTEGEFFSWLPYFAYKWGGYDKLDNNPWLWLVYEDDYLDDLQDLADAAFGFAFYLNGGDPDAWVNGPPPADQTGLLIAAEAFPDNDSCCGFTVGDKPFRQWLPIAEAKDGSSSAPRPRVYQDLLDALQHLGPDEISSIKSFLATLPPLPPFTTSQPVSTPSLGRFVFGGPAASSIGSQIRIAF